MQITKVSKFTCHYITTDDGTEYRRNGFDNWEQAYGESWEAEYNSAKLEMLFQAYMQATGEAG